MKQNNIQTKQSNIKIQPPWLIAHENLIFKEFNSEELGDGPRSQSWYIPSHSPSKLIHEYLYNLLRSKKSNQKKSANLE